MIKINEGIYFIDNDIIYNDIMNVVYPDIYNSEFLGNVHYFGYKFNYNASRQNRTAIIYWLKGLAKEKSIDTENLSKFIRKPLLVLDNEENLSSFSAVIYPRSNRSNLTLRINKEIGSLTQHYTNKISYELIKNVLMFENSKVEKVVKSIKSGKILIVDDINTSGATLTEILRIVKAINNSAEIFIFTLIVK